MTIATFLPRQSLDRLRVVLPKQHIQNATGWAHLGQIVAEPHVFAAVIDPSANGTCDILAAYKTIRASPKPVFAYVRPTSENLVAVFNLSKSGLGDAFLSTEKDNAHLLEKALEAASVNGISNAVLGAVEARLTAVSLPLRSALVNIFDRPQLYPSTAQFAKKAGISVRQLYREVERAGLGSPKKLLAAARVLRAYAYVNISGATGAHVCHELHLIEVRHLREMIRAVFSCSLEELRHSAPEDVLLCVLEWLYRPVRSECSNYGAEAT
jgi:AraC-like DNA-binding protein